MSGEANGAEARSDAGVGGSVHEESSGSAADGGTQDAPALAQNSTTTEEQLEGIAAQTRADLGDESEERYADVIRQRLADSGIDITDDEVQKLARRAAGGA